MFRRAAIFVKEQVPILVIIHKYIAVESLKGITDQTIENKKYDSKVSADTDGTFPMFMNIDSLLLIVVKLIPIKTSNY